MYTVHTFRETRVALFCVAMILSLGRYSANRHKYRAYMSPNTLFVFHKPDKMDVLLRRRRIRSDRREQGRTRKNTVINVGL